MRSKPHLDTRQEAEQARLKIESELSVGIDRDYAIAAQAALREIMLRYRDEVVLGHKGAEVEANCINRIWCTVAFVDKKLATLCTEDLQDFIPGRLTEVEPATVDRDLDVLSPVIRYSVDVWKIAAVESTSTTCVTRRLAVSLSQGNSSSPSCRLFRVTGIRLSFLRTSSHLAMWQFSAA